MTRTPDHLPPHDLLRYADGELSAAAMARSKAHLAGCAECRERLAQLKAASADLAEAQHGGAGPIADVAGPRAMLRARMAAAGETREAAALPWGLARGAAYAAALVFLLAVGFFAVRQRTLRSLADIRLLPNPAFTPGLTRVVSLADICAADHDEVVRAVPAALQQRVFREYGIADRPAGEYEVDYLITPGLGGADDVRNLWPQPHAHTVWNSYAKDQLEDHLHGMVCRGGVSLDEAQREIASDWIAAYKKYFRTSEPIAGTAAALVPAELLPAAYSQTTFATSLRRKHPWE